MKLPNIRAVLRLCLFRHHGGPMRYPIHVLLALTLLLPQPGRAQEQRPLLIGLLRVDCVALPFATHTAEEWGRLPFWSAPPVVTDFPGPWYFTARSGEKSELKPGAVVDYSSGGDSFYEGWGIGTDHDPCDPPPHYSFPVRRIGIVLSEDHPTSPFAEVRSYERHERVATAVAPIFNERERARLAQGQENEFRHPTDDARRQQEAIRLSQLYAATAEDVTYLYFVARREYPPPSGARFRPLSVLHGWAVESGDSVTVHNVELILDSDSETLVSTYMPFATLSLDGNLYAIAEMREYESSVKQVLRWSATGMQSVLPAR